MVITSANRGRTHLVLAINAVVLSMKKKGGMLFLSFLVFYILVHSIRHLPELLHGKLNWQGEATYILSIIRIAADVAISFLFALLPYLLFYHLYPQKKYFAITAGITLSLFVCFLAGFTWTSIMEHENVRPGNYLPQAAFYGIVNSVFGIAFYFVRYSRYKELSEKEAQLQNRQSELAFLRSQINPHFLFNNLNNIYSLVFYKSEQALAAIAGLSELLRYMLYDTTEAVALAVEVSYIDQYIALQQLRFETPPAVEFTKTGGMDGIVIAPLLFIPFVENAFKHGDAQAANWLKIGIVVESGRLTFLCINKKSANIISPDGGIGIDNVKRRLLLLYPGKHRLDITNDEDLFTVKLQLNYGK